MASTGDGTGELGPLAGVLLAAGTSSRMGANKLLFPIEGESVLRRATRRALVAGLKPLVVVLGHEAEKAKAELVGLECQVVMNTRYEEGISSSRSVGLAALPADTVAAVVMLADMPRVSAAMIAALVERWRETGAPLVISQYGGDPCDGGTIAPPFLYSRALFPELLALSGGSCGQRVIKNHLDQAVFVSWPASALADLDVPADYQHFETLALEGG